jgi:hypothetical protein
VSACPSFVCDNLYAEPPALSLFLSALGFFASLLLFHLAFCHDYYSPKDPKEAV